MIAALFYGRPENSVQLFGTSYAIKTPLIILICSLSAGLPVAIASHFQARSRPWHRGKEYATDQDAWLAVINAKAEAKRRVKRAVAGKKRMEPPKDLESQPNEEGSPRL